MRKLYICILVLFALMSWQKHTPEVYAFDGDAMEYFNLGLKSTMANEKINYFTTALDLNPRLAPAYEKRGLHYYFQEKYEKVIEDFTNYIRLVPDKADAYRMLGMAYLKIGTHEEAIVNFDKAINLGPDMGAAYSYRAEAFRKNGQLSEALDDAQKAIALGSDLQILSDVYRTRGKVYQELGQDMSANANFKKAAEIDPRYVFYRYISGYADLEDVGKAGLFGMIGMAFVFIFGFKLKPPRRDE
ncbi:MAG: tetratricopeptide repeat protein [Deltaproteobacteria bacterium]|nr:tetratricopeptide repeat protein [Deltaproteobacteria bacterium]MBW1748116.1 tetratricopeptide repeat protein [Deltaproteobacteria bacterium]MBW1826867.1 tetratricopeptide repeat protein [Deltaproteobacteria bacterium]MBW2156631.1 tetratricopeptide repeat protein [Deltaproteobacteria bacterium]MBW2197270.1 tetratricopeptide repeat protein [Deltaproteobacteria bacterium]